MTPGERREYLKWHKTYYPNVSLHDEDKVDELIQRWIARWRKKQTKKEAELPVYYS